MKTHLLLLSFLLLFISSCSVNENSDTSIEEPREVLKKTMERLYVVGKTKDFQNLMTEVGAKTSSGEYTDQEAEQAIEDFLVEQDPVLVELFYLLIEYVEMGILTEEELVLMAIELREAIVYDTDQGKGVCEGIDNAGLIASVLIGVIFCRDDNSSSETSTNSSGG